MSWQGYHVPNQYVLSRQLPPQRPQDGSFDRVETFTSLMTGAIALGGTAGFVINWFLGAAFHFLWSMLNDL